MIKICPCTDCEHRRSCRHAVPHDDELCDMDCPRDTAEWFTCRPATLAERLRALADGMDAVAGAMLREPPPAPTRGAELAGAAAIAREWAEQLEAE